MKKGSTVKGSQKERASKLTKTFMISEYEKLGSLKGIERICGINVQLLAKRAKELGIPIVIGQKRKYDCDDAMFATDTEHALYIAGLLAADGWIDRGNFVNISLSIKDQEYLEQIRSALGSNNPLYTKRSVKNGTVSICKTLSICSKPMYDDLVARFKLTPAKTLTLKFPKRLMRDKAVRHFIRGYTDGDGCIGVSKAGGHNWSITSTKQFCVSVRTALKRFLGVHCSLCKTWSKRSGSNGITHVLSVAGNRQVDKLLRWLYDDSTLFLKRKKDKMIGLQAWIHRVDTTMTHIQDDMVLLMRNEYDNNGLRICDIARKYGYKQETVGVLVRRERRRDI